MQPMPDAGAALTIREARTIGVTVPLTFPLGTSAATVLPVAARAGDGIDTWYDWLRQRTRPHAGGARA